MDSKTTAKKAKEPAKYPEKKQQEKTEKPKTIKRSNYTYKDMKAIKDDPAAQESLPLYEGDGKHFGDVAWALQIKTLAWVMDNDEHDTKEMLAATMALDKAPLMKGKDGQLGIDNEAAEKAYHEYLEDPAIIKMAKDLKGDLAAKEMFPHGAQRTYENVDRNKLQKKYDEAKAQLSGPAVGM